MDIERIQLLNRSLGERVLRIEFIATGNELLDGSTSDTNSRFLAENLRPLGLQIQRIVVVPDDREDIGKALVEATVRADVVIVCGGLGPTSDDLTLEIAAETFGVSMKSDAEAKKNVLTRLKRFKNVRVNESNLKQALIPAGSRVLRNDEGTAPAIEWIRGDKVFFFLPGVPREYRHVVERHLLPWFEKSVGASADGEHLFISKVFGWPESELNELMKKIRLPKNTQLGFRTHFPENHIKLIAKAKTREAAARLLRPVTKKLQASLSESLFAEGDVSFEKAFVDDFIRRKEKVAIAESCTGGLVSSMITKISGSSAVLDRAFITYSNEAKIDLLGVRKETLEKFGAVSEETAKEMVMGALSRSLAQRAVAITGIAGPTGGTPKKPVGTVWIAVAKKSKNSKKPQIKTQLLNLNYERERNQIFSAYRALHLLRNF